MKNEQPVKLLDIRNFGPSVYVLQSALEYCAVVKQRLSFLKPRLDVSSAYGDFEIEGDFMALDFAIRCNGTEVARVSKKFFSFTDRYGVEVYGNADPAFIATLVVAIDNCLHNGSSE